MLNSLKWAFPDNPSVCNHMNDTYIVTSYIVMDNLLRAKHYQDDPRIGSSTAEILTVAVVAARCFQNH